jgi:hypothetical protein
MRGEDQIKTMNQCGGAGNPTANSQSPHGEFSSAGSPAGVNIATCLQLENGEAGFLRPQFLRGWR